MVKDKDTPAKRARERRDPAVGLPPRPPRRERDLDDLRITIEGIEYRLGPRLAATGNTLELTMEGASALRLTVADPDGRLLWMLPDEEARLQHGVTVELDDVVYVLDEVEVTADGTLSLVLYDQVSARLRLFHKYRSRRRSRVTRAEFVKLLVDEASAGARADLDAFIPELTDRQPVLTARNTGKSAGD